MINQFLGAREGKSHNTIASSQTTLFLSGLTTLRWTLPNHVNLLLLIQHFFHPFCCQCNIRDVYFFSLKKQRKEKWKLSSPLQVFWRKLHSWQRNSGRKMCSFRVTSSMIHRLNWVLAMPKRAMGCWAHFQQIGVLGSLCHISSCQF